MSFKRVAIYCRISKAGQNCKRQERDLVEYAKNDRLERKKVLALAQARKIEIILITELTRWGRSTPDEAEHASGITCRKRKYLAQSLQIFERTIEKALALGDIQHWDGRILKQRVTDAVSSVTGGRMS